MSPSCRYRSIHDRILEYHAITERLYEAAVSESESRREHSESLRKNERKGKYGTCEAEEEAQKKRARDFERGTLQTLMSQLKIVSQSYQGWNPQGNL